MVPKRRDAAATLVLVATIPVQLGEASQRPSGRKPLRRRDIHRRDALLQVPISIYATILESPSPRTPRPPEPQNQKATIPETFCPVGLRMSD